MAAILKLSNWGIEQLKNPDIAFFKLLNYKISQLLNFLQA